MLKLTCENYVESFKYLSRHTSSRTRMHIMLEKNEYACSKKCASIIEENLCDSHKCKAETTSSEMKRLVGGNSQLYCVTIHVCHHHNYATKLILGVPFMYEKDLRVMHERCINIFLRFIYTHFFMDIRDVWAKFA
jgi:hypothetical protein